MAQHDPTLIDSLVRAWEEARGKVEPYLTWLPDWLEPYAVEIVAGDHQPPTGGAARQAEVRLALKRASRGIGSLH